jgi:hypothetical protein
MKRIAVLLATLALAACGAPAPATETATFRLEYGISTSPARSPTATSSSDAAADATATRLAYTPVTRRGVPGEPAPDPTRVAAGAPLRATLLAQLDELERRCWMATPAVPGGRCRLWGGTSSDAGPGTVPAELVAYAHWYGTAWACESTIENFEGTRAMYFGKAAMSYGTVDTLRAPYLLDAYVGGVMWCGLPRTEP